jgi:DNA polymerase III subunit beta
MTTSTKKRPATAWTIAAPDLRAALTAVAPAINAKHATFSGVRLGAYGAEAFNGELRVLVDLEGADFEPYVVPHARLAAIAGMAVGDVSFARDGNNVRITAGRGQWTLPVIDGEWPERGDNAGKPFLRLPVDQFCRVVKSVVGATDDDSSRYALGGVLVEQRKGDVAFVATDGRRLHVAFAEVDQAVDDASCIIPSHAINTLAKLAAVNADDAIQLSLAGNELVADMDGVTLWARLLDGRFPKWAEVIPKNIRPDFGTGEDKVFKAPPAHAEVTAGELLAAVRQASIVVNETSRGVQFTFVDNGLMLAARSADYGESTVTAELSMAAIKATVRLDPTFVAGWLRNVDPGAIIEVFATDAESAVVMRHEDALAVVMPLAAE